MSTLEVWGVPGIPEVRPGDDLAALVATALSGSAAVADSDAGPADSGAAVRDGDVVVVTSKVVSKAEGRLLRAVDRDDAVDAETVDVVAEWHNAQGRTRVARTRHGLVLAAAGVDASNVEAGTVALLPEDPDGSARALRRGLRERLGVSVGVVVTDTAGRPWREGLVDLAIGAAGLRVLDDLRGRIDPYGHVLEVTVVAVADEVAAASELVRGKLARVPVALVRGLAHLVTAADGPGAAALVRRRADDRFALGTREAVAAAVGAATLSPPDLTRVDEAAARAAAALLAEGAGAAPVEVRSHGDGTAALEVGGAAAAQARVVALLHVLLSR